MEYLYNRIGKCKVKLIGTHLKEEKDKKKGEEKLNLLRKHLILLKKLNDEEGYPEIQSILPIDSIMRIGIDELIQDITEDYDTTTVVVTHDMNSVMGIGENIMFIYKGEKLWEGNKNDVAHSGVKELDDFVFANKIMLGMKGK